jgi:hypothetical protein
MKRIMFIVGALVVLMGCASAFTLSPEQRIAITSGQIGCPPEKIAIENLQRPGGGMSTWSAKCDGRTYYCSRESNKSTCREVAK